MMCEFYIPQRIEVGREERGSWHDLVLDAQGNCASRVRQSACTGVGRQPLLPTTMASSIRSLQAAGRVAVRSPATVRSLSTTRILRDTAVPVGANLGTVPPPKKPVGGFRGGCATFNLSFTRPLLKTAILFFTFVMTDMLRCYVHAH
jgi:hypothetical protein